MTPDASDLRTLASRFPPPAGRLQAIVLRPARGAPAVPADEADAVPGRGLVGDRSRGGTRQVTLIQAEHLPLVGAWLGQPALDPLRLRRNLVIAGLNLVSARSPFKDRPQLLCIGETVQLAIGGPCDPCSKMEAEFGPGAWNALRGHGGVVARVIVGGRLALGDAVRVQAVTDGLPE